LFETNSGQTHSVSDLQHCKKGSMVEKIRILRIGKFPVRIQKQFRLYLEPTLERTAGGEEPGAAGVEAVRVDGGRVLVLHRLHEGVVTLLHNKLTLRIMLCLDP